MIKRRRKGKIRIIRKVAGKGEEITDSLLCELFTDGMVLELGAHWTSNYMLPSFRDFRYECPPKKRTTYEKGNSKPKTPD